MLTVVKVIHPTHGQFSANPAIIDSSDENFYHSIELRLLPEHGFKASHFFVTNFFELGIVFSARAPLEALQLRR